MRTFAFLRHVDHSGCSGTGLVAQGCEFDDGTVVMRWLTEHRSTCFYPDAETLERIHGHDGDSEIVWFGEQLPMPTDKRLVRAIALLGERITVAVQFDGGEPIQLTTGRLAGVSDSGNTAVLDDRGGVSYFWPALDHQAIEITPTGDGGR